jgi:hypothetical protein
MARAWLDHLSGNTIDSWEDLKEIFTPLELEGLPVEAGRIPSGLHPMILKNCHELPKVGNLLDGVADDISAFWSDTSYQTLVHELSHDQLKTTKEPLDNAT